MFRTKQLLFFRIKVLKLIINKNYLQNKTAIKSVSWISFSNLFASTSSMTSEWSGERLFNASVGDITDDATRINRKVSNMDEGLTEKKGRQKDLIGGPHDLSFNKLTNMWLNAKVDTKWANTLTRLLPTDGKDNGTQGTLSTETLDEVFVFWSDGNDEGERVVNDKSVDESNEDEHKDGGNEDGVDENDDFCSEDIVVLEGDPVVSLLRAITLTLSVLTQNNDCWNNLVKK